MKSRHITFYSDGILQTDCNKMQINHINQSFSINHKYALIAHTLLVCKLQKCHQLKHTFHSSCGESKKERKKKHTNQMRRWKKFTSLFCCYRTKPLEFEELVEYQSE